MTVHSFHGCTVFSPQDPFQENYQRFDFIRVLFMQVPVRGRREDLRSDAIWDPAPPARSAGATYENSKATFVIDRL